MLSVFEESIIVLQAPAQFSKNRGDVPNTLSSFESNALGKGTVLKNQGIREGGRL